ncbi:hypothetical protein GF371_03950 [Candidatus Woesearchaeota archaeon]|nr:hypothetical protein [Candidatus Woesearchaeota archaeon]
MNLEQAHSIIESNKRTLEKTGIRMNRSGWPIILAARIDYKAVCDASLHLLNNAVFYTEIKLNLDRKGNTIVPDTAGLEEILKNIRNLRFSNVPKAPGILDAVYNRNSSGILHAFATYNNNKSDYHTHPVMHNNLNDPNYFLSITDLIYEMSIFFFPIDYASLAKVKTEKELEQEKQAIAQRMQESKVKGFAVKLSDTTHTMAPWWEALDHLQDSGTTAIVYPIAAP